MNANTAKTVDLSAIRTLESNASSLLAAATARLVRTAEFVWKGLFDTEMRINVGPGVTRDAKADLREKYLYLGRVQ